MSALLVLLLLDLVGAATARLLPPVQGSPARRYLGSWARAGTFGVVAFSAAVTIFGAARTTALRDAIAVLPPFEIVTLSSGLHAGWTALLWLAMQPKDAEVERYLSSAAISPVGAPTYFSKVLAPGIVWLLLFTANRGLFVYSDAVRIQTLGGAFVSTVAISELVDVRLIAEGDAARLQLEFENGDTYLTDSDAEVHGARSVEEVYRVLTLRLSNGNR